MQKILRSGQLPANDHPEELQKEQLLVFGRSKYAPKRPRELRVWGDIGGDTTAQVYRDSYTNEIHDSLHYF